MNKKTKTVLIGFLAASLLTTGATASGVGQGRAAVYPDIADTSHASKKAASYFASFFTAKSRHDVDATMRHFNEDQTLYYDGTVGAAYDSHDVLKETFSQFMPAWPKEALSYPTRIIGDTNSAMVLFTDTQEMFGGDLRVIAPVDFEDGEITRWVDYWDARNFGAAAVEPVRVPADKFPQKFGEDKAGNHASKVVDRVARKLNDALNRNDAEAAAELFSYDAVFEDMTLRTTVQGRPAIGRYLQRALPALPYGPGSSVRHVVGSDQGGGYEWQAAGKAVPRGVTALELDANGKITRLIAVWDGGLLSDQAMSSLTALSVDR